MPEEALPKKWCKFSLRFVNTLYIETKTKQGNVLLGLGLPLVVTSLVQVSSAVVPFRSKLERGLGGKLKGKILERCRVVSWWIRFGERSLCCLLEGVEACCRGEDEKLRNKGWVEDGREFRLELRSNVAGRSLPGGWSILVEKLHFLGVVSSSKEMKLPSSRSLEIGGSSANPLKGSIVDLIKKEHDPTPDLLALRSWVGHNWSLRAGVRFFLLRGALLLFEFEDGSNAEMVLSMGVRRFKGTVLHLDRYPRGRVLSKR
ncbi:hypothetical protein CK203_034378 [Vitis vinifera]|uniref:DUF4283 domain-containing protein n=1 Tax=Vitis vinifera TaxID=29760 RepID=A0A438HZK1_VITVI|nr:hypothetical protein CK203_034378 [Vitis vinifera]